MSVRRTECYDDKRECVRKRERRESVERERKECVCDRESTSSERQVTLLCVCTAQEPTKAVIKNLTNEVPPRTHHFAHLFALDTILSLLRNDSSFYMSLFLFIATSLDSLLPHLPPLLQVRKMGLASLFDCEEWDHSCVNDMFGMWGDNEGLSDERLQAKLVRGLVSYDCLF